MAIDRDVMFIGALNDDAAGNAAGMAFEFDGFMCNGDVTIDCVVDVDDLIEVVLNWGSCSGCAADLDGNGEVDVDDLVAVVLAWGDCPCAIDLKDPDGLQTVIEDAGLDYPDDWDDFVDVMTNSQDEDEKANYLCWMEHYLDSCHPLCMSPPNCPDDDPWGNH